jgi:hypothetical protein
MKLLLLALPGFIAVLIMFFIGALKARKNRFLWGVLGAISYLIPVFVFSPIVWNILVGSAREAGRDGAGLPIFSVGVIISAIGIFSSIVVYKKILLKPAQFTVEQNAPIFCSECGTQCSANTAFCNKCGSKIGGA